MALSVDQSRSLEEMKRELSAWRALMGWYGRRGDYAMQQHLSDECWGLFVKIGRLEAQNNLQSMSGRPNASANPANLSTHAGGETMSADRDAEGKQMEIEGDPPKAYRLYRLNEKDEPIAVVAEADTQEDLAKMYKRRLDWRYAVYHGRNQISY
jgi:hypothetical protein